MSNILLSIVIPTKNRNQYIKSIVEYIACFANNELELIIQDNSDKNDLSNYLEEKQFDFVRYFYVKKHLSVVENSDLAIKNARGKYICYVGDDDIISRYILDFVKIMEENDIESAVFNSCQYNWSGVAHFKHKFKNLRIPRMSNKIKKLDVKQILQKGLKIGFTRIEKMPRVYHGIIKKECLEYIYIKVGTYFPGPSPDMANAVALCNIVKNHIFYNIPIVSSGTSPKSAGGRGAKHEHVGHLKDQSFLPKNIETRWNKKIPKVWTAETIYAQSALEAMRKMEMNKEYKKYNYIYLYAAFYSFHKNMANILPCKFQVKEKIYFGIYLINIFL